ncbi:hypothetical protein BT69DRAFT_1346239 [Atractiella rhizophila]|nr:hypothetical protein BT69DRAFT_1346239 [Atractiella rhizophila]
MRALAADILSRSTQGFGIYWLAATLGARSQLRRLTKKELLSASITSACAKLAAPTEPLALRLSASLLMGIARVYGQQWTLWIADCEALKSSLKRAVHVATIEEKGKEGLDMPHPQARKEAITRGEAFEVGDYAGWTYDPYAWFLVEQQWTGRATPVDDEGEEGWFEPYAPSEAPPSTVEQKRAAESGKRKRRPTTVASNEEISLREEDLNYNYSQDREDDALRMEDLGLESDMGWEGRGLLAGLDAELDAQLGILDEAELQMPMDEGGFALDQQGDVSFATDGGMDFGMGFDVGAPGTGSLSGSGAVLLGMDETHALYEKDQQGEGMSAGDAKARKRRRAESPFEEEEVVQLPTPKEWKKKARRTFHLDRATSLASAEVRGLESYRELMEQERGEKQEREKRKEGEELARKLVLGSHSLFDVEGAGGELDNFFKDSVDAILKARREARQGFEDSPSRSITRSQRRGRPRIQITSPFPSSRPSPRDIPPFDPQLMDVDFPSVATGVMGDFSFNDQLPAMLTEMEGEFLPLTRREEEELMDDLEIRRAGDVDSQSQRSSIMPWNRRASAVGGSDVGYAPYIPGAGSSYTGGSRARGSSQLETPGYLRSGSRGGRFSSVQPAPSPLAAMGGVTNGGVDFEEEDDSQGFLPPLQRETFNFLEFAKAQRDELKLPGDFHFSDIAPIAATDPAVAAQAFYHVLMLTSKGLMTTHQEEAFGEIIISF